MVHPLNGHYGRCTAPIRSQEPGTSSWSPMGCRAQALGPSSIALSGHSRELAWKRGNWDRIRRPDPGLEPGVPAPRLTRLILRLAAPAHRVLVPVEAPDSVLVAPLPGQLSAVAQECNGGWPKCLGPAPHGRPGEAPGSCLQISTVRWPRRPLEGEPKAKEDLSLCLSLTVHSACQKIKIKKNPTMLPVITLTHIFNCS